MRRPSPYLGCSGYSLNQGAHGAGNNAQKGTSTGRRGGDLGRLCCRPSETVSIARMPSPPCLRNRNCSLESTRSREARSLSSEVTRFIRRLPLMRIETSYGSRTLGHFLITTRSLPMESQFTRFLAITTGTTAKSHQSKRANWRKTLAIPPKERAGGWRGGTSGLRLPTGSFRCLRRRNLFFVSRRAAREA
jgi:hypothetical protein